ncbi:DsbA family protein [Candidatus Nitrospira bockiana]
MNVRSSRRLPTLRVAAGLMVLLVGALSSMPAVAATAPPQLQGKYTVLSEPSTHTPGKVKLIEFADFYCPHCHKFDEQAIPIIEKEFGDRVEVTLVGFPVIPGKLPTAFDMYEQAKIMGKGREMKRVLFRTIHKDGLHILDKVIRESLIKEVGLDPVAFEAGMASGKPARAVEDGRKWGLRVKVDHTPTVILDGNIKLESIDPDNVKTVIRSILEADAKR